VEPTTADTAEVQALVRRGAQLIEVLPPSAYRREHLPGASNIPLPELDAEAIGALDPSKPTVVYCYDHECDLSSRGAARLLAFGFTEVYDYSGSKTAWLGEGLPSEGEVRDEDRAGARATTAPTCPPEATVGEVSGDLRAAGTAVVVVVDDAGLVLGALHPNAAGLPADTPVLRAADPAPPTVRPSITRFELAESMDGDGQDHVLVATSHGRLLGVVRRQDLD
jgi:rhodanese-related sulfurtransferase/CBS domain-containing protein